ncbi:phosphohistidine phosphatase SixA [Pseudomonas sp. PDM16]|uniref:phosphohistidine phosphatase SixA n=1 Tax=Pseudomonas sp. PDM16 TaxID=2769292 RepID=UPI00177DBC46|nr:phosphohistidine phosphatase SixA [Pseudomonas sp. PDM16]MBD9416028.1 phosphohistidine phosphatase SixA [Pseudomonas sp. PDM16]
MTLWLLRHGEAEPRARSDAERALTEGGRKEVRRSAEHLRGQPLQHILVSPYLRAQQTAEIVREVLGLKLSLTTVDWATPDDSPREAANRLDDHPGECLLVSHNPLLGSLSGLLVHGHLQQPMGLRTASLVALEGDPVPGLMQLCALYHPH